MHVSYDQSLKCISNCVSVIVEIDLRNLESIAALKYTLFAFSFSLNEYLAWRNVI